MPAQVFDANSAYETPIPQEDGSEANETIDELSNLQAVSSPGAQQAMHLHPTLCTACCHWRSPPQQPRSIHFRPEVHFDACCDVWWRW